MAATAPLQVEIPATVFTEGNDSIKKASDTFNPYSDTLTPAEIQRRAKANDKTYNFLTEALAGCEQHPEWLSSHFRLDDFKGFMNNVDGLRISELKAKDVYTMLMITRIVNSSNAYEIALDFYNGVKRAAKSNVPGAQNLYKKLSARFPGHKKKKPAPRTEESIVRKVEGRKAA